MLEDKDKSIEYWDKVAKEWDSMSYNRDKEYVTFPFSEVRHKIIIDELKKQGDMDVTVLDIGCADGRFVRDLIRERFSNVKGIDNSPKMIEEAKAQLKKEFPDINPEKVFSVGDADSLSSEETYDVITALGLIEYVEDINDFFRLVSRIMNKNGVSYIESRNKLFNLFSANKHTVESDIEALEAEIDEIKVLSPVKRFDDLIRNTFIKIGDELKDFMLDPSVDKPGEEIYPFDLPQYTPKELMNFCGKQGLEVKEVVYYHCHPFVPRFEKEFPRIFNKIGVMMQPLGYTHIGSLICSSFVAKVVPAGTTR